MRSDSLPLDILRRSLDFHGRLSRGRYWRWILLSTTLVVVAFVLEAFVFGHVVTTKASGSPHIDLLPPLVDAAIIALALPNAAATARRLHDTGMSGWWQLLVLIPIAGPPLVLTFAARHGHPGPNRYGPDPSARATPIQRVATPAPPLADHA